MENSISLAAFGSERCQLLIDSTKEEWYYNFRLLEHIADSAWLQKTKRLQSGSKVSSFHGVAVGQSNWTIHE